jgi:two-component system LytT family response regulator
MMVNARRAVQSRGADPAPVKPTPPRGERLMVKGTGRIYFVKIDEIDWCQAAGNYVRVHVSRQEHFMRKTMVELERELDPSRFVRIHRSTIVNVDSVEELRPLFGGDYLVVLRGGTELTMSRRYRRAAARLFGDEARDH